jgi:hypothetical protein
MGSVDVAGLRITNPPALFMPVIVWTGFSSGLVPALLAAAIGWSYTVYFFYDPSAPRFFSSDDLRRSCCGRSRCR